MVEPYTPIEQVANDLFVPDLRFGLLFATSKYDAVWKLESGETRNVYDDLATVQDDCRTIEVMYKAYKFETTDELRLDNSPDWKKVVTARKYIMSQLQNKPDQKIAIFYGFACHGIADNGKQTVLVNTFNK